MRRMSFAEALARFILWILIFTVFILLLANAFGCSSVEAIGKESSSILELSQSSEERFEKIAGISQNDEVKNESKHGIIEQDEIQNSVANIRKELPRVEDKESSLMELMQRISLAGILIAVVIILWQTGIGTLLRKLLYSISWFIPSKSKREAEMDLKAVDENNAMTLREVIASKRASDAAYNSAYINARKKK